MKNERQKLLILIITAGVFFLTVPKPAYALFGYSFADILAEIFNGILGVVGLFTRLCAWLLELSINISVKQLSVFFNMEAINIGWGAARDIANMFFIFILLYIAIGMILQLSNVNPQRMITRVIIIALLVNFSGAATKAVIDVSNMFTDLFYAEVNKPPGLGNNFIAYLQIQKNLGESQTTSSQASSLSDNIYPLPDGYIEVTNGEAWGFNNANNVRYQMEMREAVNRVRDAEEYNKGSGWGAVYQLLGGIIMLILAGMVFLAAAVMFMIRTTVLLILYILSPLAFLAYAYPGTEKLGNQWWDKLVNQSFFAPIYMFFVYITLAMASGLNDTMSNITSSAGINSQELNFALAPVALYIVLISFMAGSLIAAQKMGAYGSKLAMDTVKGAGWRSVGMLGRNTIGRLGGGVSRLSRAAAEKGLIRESQSRVLQHIGDAAVKAKFGGRASRTDVMKRKAEDVGGRMGEFRRDPYRQAAYLSRLDTRARTEAMKNLSESNLADIEEEAKKSRNPKLQEIINEHIAGMPPETQRKFAKAKDERREAEEKALNKEAVERLGMGEVAEVDDMGKLKRNADGTVKYANAQILDSAEKREEAIAKFIKTISANDIKNIVGLLKFDTDKERERSEHIIKGLSKTQMNKLLKEDVFKSDEQIAGVSEVINGLDDNNSLKQYATAAPGHQILNIKENPVPPAIRANISTLKKSMLDLRAEVEREHISSPSGATPLSPGEIENRTFVKIRDSLSGMEAKNMKHVVNSLSFEPSEKARIKTVISSLDGEQLEAFNKGLTPLHRTKLDSIFSSETVNASADPHYAAQLDALGVKYNKTV